MAGGRIDCYIDIASLYSYFGFTFLHRDRHLLAAHSIEVEFHPVFLGAINASTGNKPPWMLPAKGKYLEYDVRRTKERAGKPEITPPEDFASMSHTVLPGRALLYIKRHYPKETYETTTHFLFHTFWTPPNPNLTKLDILTNVLSEVPAGFEGAGQTGAGGKVLFTADEVQAMVGWVETQEAKDQFAASTQEALDRGAFGCPWIWVRNAAGEEEPFFGSDRFHFVYKFLGLPFQDVTLFGPVGQQDQSESKL